MSFKKSGLYRSFSGEMKLLQEINELFFSVEIWLLNDSANRNDWQYENIEKNKDQFAGTPILIAYVNGGKQIGDGHNFEMETDKDGNPAPSFTAATAERIVGSLSEDVKDIRIERRDGKTWVVGKGKLWRWYAKEAVDKIERDARKGRSMSISIETLVTKSRMEGKIEVEEEYKILGTTILGDHVQPAVADAHIAALAKSEMFKELKIRAASLQNGTPEPQKSFEKGMKTTMEIFNRPQLDTLQSRFNGYVVLSAVRDENGVHAALRDEKFALYTYSMEAETDTVAPEKIVSCAAKLNFENGCMVDAYEFMAETVEALSHCSAELESMKKTLSERDNMISKMRETENARRLNAAKSAAAATLERFNASREDKIDGKAIEGVLSDIDSGNFTAIVNAEGVWTGDKAVENAVYAVCAREVQKQDEEKARNAQKEFVWSGIQGGNAPHGGIEGLLNDWGIR